MFRTVAEKTLLLYFILVIENEEPRKIGRRGRQLRVTKKSDIISSLFHSYRVNLFEGRKKVIVLPSQIQEQIQASYREGVD